MQRDTPQSVLSGATRRKSWIALVCVTVLAAVPIFWQLGTRYLWQDEAACAVLAERLMQTGKPLGWDGRNLITMDEYRPQEGAELMQLAHDEQRTVQHFVDHGDFKSDTTWIGQPWGQFVLAGVSLALFGKDTLQARLPFAIAAVLTVLLLFHFVRSRFADQRLAWIAVALLLANTYWFLHARQCRYYSTATLGLLATLVAYTRWQDGKRWGAALFVACGWLWFQNDFGSPWPVFGILFFDALRVARSRWLTISTTFAILGASLAPFVVFYQLHTRVKRAWVPWDQKLFSTLYNTNQFQLPFVIAVAAVWLLWRDRNTSPSPQRRCIALCLAIVAAKMLWMPTVGPQHFYRYVVDLTPLSALIVAYVVLRAGQACSGSFARQTLVAGALATVQIASSVFAQPVALLMPEHSQSYSLPGWIVRPELKAYGMELAGTAPDPNRDAIEYLKPRLQADDEILVNYEDVPWMFYVPNRIRGGIPGFRALDDRAPPPRFVVFRRTVPFVHSAIFAAVFGSGGSIDAAHWDLLPAHIADMIWGNNPDPGYHYSQQMVLREEAHNPEVLVLEARAPR